MSSNQAKGEAIHAKMALEAARVVGGVEMGLLRRIQHSGIQCLDRCYRQAGSTWPNDRLQRCSNACQVPFQQASEILQTEVDQFQERLQRNLVKCQDKARDSVPPGMGDDKVQIQQAEEIALKCMERTVDDHIKLLQPMKERLEAQLKEFLAKT